MPGVKDRMDKRSTHLHLQYAVFAVAMISLVIVAFEIRKPATRIRQPLHAELHEVDTYLKAKARMNEIASRLANEKLSRSKTYLESDPKKTGVERTVDVTLQLVPWRMLRCGSSEDQTIQMVYIGQKQTNDSWGIYGIEEFHLFIVIEGEHPRLSRVDWNEDHEFVEVTHRAEWSDVVNQLSEIIDR